MKKRPTIAIFDSGIGGLGALKMCHKKFDCDFVYVMDNKFCPYGEKSCDQIEKRVVGICSYVQSMYDVDAIVIACNTATSIAIQKLRSAFDIPIIGMEPPIKPAIKAGYKNICVMSTPVTNKHCGVIEQFRASNVDVVSYAKLAKIIQDDFGNKYKIKSEIEKGLTPSIKQKCDAVVLGCSHFQFAQNEILQEFGRNVTFFKSEEGVTKRLQNILGLNSCSSLGKIYFEQTQLDERLLKLSLHILDLD